MTQRENGFFNKTLKMVSIIKEKTNEHNYVRIENVKRCERQTTDEMFAIRFTTEELITTRCKELKRIIDPLSKTT